MTPLSPEPEDCAKLQRRLERERLARIEAEAIAERGLRDLYVREQQIQLLARIAAAANQSHSVRDVLQFAVTQICEATGWPIGHVCIAGESNGTRLRSMAVWHVASPDSIAAFQVATESMVFEPGIGLPGQVYAERAPQWRHDLTQAGNFPRLEAALACGLRAGCAFPIMVGDEVTAVLEFFTYSVMEKDDSLLELMAQIGWQLGRVIERKRAEDQLIHDASHDPLTGLPNRALFLDRLNQAMIRHRIGREEFAMLFIDLDRFKVVNDSLGHLAGDQLIIEVARRLRFSLRPDDDNGGCSPRQGDTLARLGGDEFTILLTNIVDPSNAIRVANRIQEVLSRSFVIEGQEVYTSASIGIASSATGYASSEEVLRDADLAMYRAKAMGKARCEIYDQDMHKAAVKRLKLEADLRRGLSNNEFILHYQPIVSLMTGGITGFEALLRWQNPYEGLIYPDAFIDVAEDTGIILFLGIWALREACTTIRYLQNEFPCEKPLTISVNISPRQFAQPDLVSQVRQVVTETGIDPTTLRLEITERVTAGDSERVVEILTQLKEIGVRLSIDDFGTGYSSLSYLHRFPLDVLKIDRSFISKIDESDECLQIVRTIMNLAQNLEMEVVAEGPELQSQVTELQKLGCDFGQGYFFSQPIDLTDVRQLLASPGWAQLMTQDAEGVSWHDQQLARMAQGLRAKRSRRA